MSDVLANALDKRSSLRSELRRVERFIENYHAFSEGRVVQPQKCRRNCVIGRPAEAWEQIKSVLAVASTPLSREEIRQACADNGYEMPGKSPTDYVGIVVFRHKNELEISNGRYRLAALSEKPQ